MDPLQMSREAYLASTSYIDANYRARWEDNLRLFQNRHPSGSKYNSKFFEARSKIFRPKTRSVVRKNEAAAAIAFFGTPDVVTCEAESASNKLQAASAAVMQELLNYRLQKSIPWFRVLIGGMQDAQVMGAVCSYNYWKFRLSSDQTRVLDDKPCIELIPLENLRFDANSDWLDPINSSPIVQRIVPMYANDVREMMRQPNAKTGAPAWKTLSDGEIRAAQMEFDSTRQVRQDKRQDPAVEMKSPIKQYEVVWAMENFARMGSDEYTWWTMGYTHLLTDPAPLEQVYFHGLRPLTFGVAVIETHKALPAAPVELGAGLQTEANEVVNQRLDNVKLVLNKRWFVKTGVQIDIDSLNRNAAGAVTLGENISEDAVREISWPDVTASAYMEQDRINADYDDLMGNFSGSSVMTNRKLNETVGGMGLLSQGASQLTEYLLHTVKETWVEPTLNQLAKLEAAYETDETVLFLAGQNAKLLQRYGMNQVTDQMLSQDAVVKCNVGMNATDPMLRLQKFTLGIKTYAEIAQLAVASPQLDIREIGKELFGVLGYQDGSRFMTDDQDPRAMQAQQTIQKLQSIIEEQQAQLHSKEVDQKTKVAETAANIKLTNAQTVKTLVEADNIEAGDPQREGRKFQLELHRMQHERDIASLPGQDLSNAQAASQVKALQDDVITGRIVEAVQRLNHGNQTLANTLHAFTSSQPQQAEQAAAVLDLLRGQEKSSADLASAHAELMQAVSRLAKVAGAKRRLITNEHGDPVASEIGD